MTSKSECICGRRDCSVCAIQRSVFTDMDEAMVKLLVKGRDGSFSINGVRVGTIQGMQADSIIIDEVPVKDEHISVADEVWADLEVMRLPRKGARWKEREAIQFFHQANHVGKSHFLDIETHQLEHRLERYQRQSSKRRTPLRQRNKDLEQRISTLERVELKYREALSRLLESEVEKAELEALLQVKDEEIEQLQNEEEKLIRRVKIKAAIRKDRE